MVMVRADEGRRFQMGFEVCVGVFPGSGAVGKNCGTEERFGHPEE